MTENDLGFYSSWASIISFFVSLISLAYVRSIKTNIIKFRRKQRVRQLIEDVLRIPNDAVPLTDASLIKLAALKRNVPRHAWGRFTSRGRAALDLHKHIDAKDLASIKEAINDWASYSEEA